VRTRELSSKDNLAHVWGSINEHLGKYNTISTVFPARRFACHRDLKLKCVMHA
jgi:hypothetical protein